MRTHSGDGDEGYRQEGRDNNRRCRQQNPLERVDADDGRESEAPRSDESVVFFPALDQVANHHSEVEGDGHGQDGQQEDHRHAGEERPRLGPFDDAVERRRDVRPEQLSVQFTLEFVNSPYGLRARPSLECFRLQLNEPYRVHDHAGEGRAYSIGHRLLGHEKRQRGRTELRVVHGGWVEHPRGNVDQRPVEARVVGDAHDSDGYPGGGFL